MAATYNPKVSAKVNDRYAISSNVVHLHGADHHFELFVAEWSCIVRFLDDVGASRYDVVEVDGVLNVNLYNHRNLNGECIFTPITLAKAGNWYISLTYWTRPVDETLTFRRFEYTVWVEEKK